MRPLEGVKVIEFASHVVVPAATRMMAELGADVIKVERAAGDPWRTYPYGVPSEMLFTVLNAGKRMTSFNLKTPQGKDALMRLLKDADIFCTNFRPAPVKRLGLDYDTLHSQFPGLVYCDFTGYGGEGPDADRAGFDSTSFWAASGLLGDLVYEGEQPFMPPLAVGDMISANVMFGGMLAALHHRDKTGEGQYITSSLYASGIWQNFAAIVACQDGYAVNKMPRKRNYNSPTADIHKCADGKHLLVSVSAYKGDYAPFMKIMGLEEYLEKDEYKDLKSMYANRDVIRSVIKERFLTDTAQHWSEKLAEADIVNQILNTANDLTKSEQAWANDYFNEVSFPDGEKGVLPKPPVHFPRMEKVQTQPAKELGADTSAVLRELGFGDADIKEMLETGAAAGK